MSTPVALITGAARGLGRSIAIAFANQGYTIGLHYFQSATPAQKLSEEIQKSGGRALLLKADVRSSKEIDGIVKELADRAGRIDVLVNNAGNVHNRTIIKMSDGEWRDAISVNLDGPFYCTRAVLPIMRTQKEGSIVNIGSYATRRNVKGAANYIAAKAGLLALTQCTALEEGAHNIRANAVMPGFHVTDINRDVWQKFQKEIRAQHLLSKMPVAGELADFVVGVSRLRTVTGQVFSFESRL